MEKAKWLMPKRKLIMQLKQEINAAPDFFHAPNIDEIDLKEYSGAVGETIRVRVTDDFRVEQVQVSIVNSDGSLVEQGDAIK